MNEVVNKYLLTGDKSMPELHLRQRRFIYSACGPFTKHCKRILNLKKTSDFNYIYKNKLDKACLTHDPKFFDKKIGSGARATSKTGGIVIEVQAHELHKPLITKFRRKKCI